MDDNGKVRGYALSPSGERARGRERALAFTVNLAALLAASFLLMWSAGANSARHNQTRALEDNNPEKFYLVASNSAYTYSFTYDPLAQDQWLFRTGDGSTLGEPFLR